MVWSAVQNLKWQGSLYVFSPPPPMLHYSYTLNILFIYISFLTSGRAQHDDVTVMVRLQSYIPVMSPEHNLTPRWTDCVTQWTGLGLMAYSITQSHLTCLIIRYGTKVSVKHMVYWWVWLLLRKGKEQIAAFGEEINSEFKPFYCVM
jgi:hypothetical protein